MSLNVLRMAANTESEDTLIKKMRSQLVICESTSRVVGENLPYKQQWHQETPKQHEKGLSKAYWKLDQS
jgi:hypothetical protein